MALPVLALGGRRKENGRNYTASTRGVTVQTPTGMWTSSRCLATMREADAVPDGIDDLETHGPAIDIGRIVGVRNRSRRCLTVPNATARYASHKCQSEIGPGLFGGDWEG